MNTAPDKLAARETFLADILCLAATSPTLTRWAEVLEAFTTASGAPHGGADAWLTVSCETRIEEFPTTQVRVLPMNISQALRKVNVDPDLVASPRWRAHIMAARHDNDASRLTPRDADMLVQIAVFGEVRFP